MRSLFRFLFNVLRAFVRTVDLLVRAAFYALLIFGAGALVAYFLRPAPQLPTDGALLLRPSGSLVEQAVLNAPLELLTSSGAPTGQVLLSDLLEAVRSARDDERIRALVIETDELVAGGLSKLAELRSAIADFKTSGKPVLARGERFTQSQYYLASIADEVHLAPDGFVLLHGLSRYGLYFKDALDRLGVKMHVFRVGEYKSFAEPFIRNDMSEEDRTSSRELLADLWAVIRDDIAAARKLGADALDAHVQGYRSALAAASGDAALAAHTAGLIDELSTRDQWRARLIAAVGTAANGDGARTVEVSSYLAAARAAQAPAADKLAVLVAQGAIVDGDEAAGVVGGDTLARQIRGAREDKDVKALVLRIDSPGGSASASEVIRRELELTRQAGKPVIASMSSVAASGGYWIAAGADEIWAAPASLTGSIGIFALFPELGVPLNRLGITVDGVATAPLAGALDPRRPLNEEAAAAMQLGIEHGYRRFLQTVADARRMSVDEVDEVARGRVWTGAAAAQLGLVDQLGGLQEAIAAAARRAGVEHYEVVWPEAGESLQQRLLRRLLSGAAQLGFQLPVSVSPTLAALLDSVQLPLAELARWNDPQYRYMHCLCEAP